MDELKKCPFCGSEKAAVYHDTRSDHRYDWDFHVECTDCGAAGEHDKNRDEATAAWNRRPAAIALTDDEIWVIWHETYRNAHTFKSTNLAFARALFAAQEAKEKNHDAN